eukprot:129519_1
MGHPTKLKPEKETDAKPGKIEIPSDEFQVSMSKSARRKLRSQAKVPKAASPNLIKQRSPTRLSQTNSATTKSALMKPTNTFSNVTGRGTAVQSDKSQVSKSPNSMQNDSRNNAFDFQLESFESHFPKLNSQQSPGMPPLVKPLVSPKVKKAPVTEKPEASRPSRNNTDSTPLPLKEFPEPTGNVSSQ